MCTKYKTEKTTSHICSECFEPSDNLTDINEVLTGRVRDWVVSGKYKLGEYAEECGTPAPKGFVSSWDGAEGVHFICKQCNCLARDAYDECASSWHEFQWELENDPTGQTQELYGR